MLSWIKYDPVSGKFRWVVDRANKKAGSIAGNVHPLGYRTICINYRVYYAHRLAFELMGVPILKGQYVDHINGKRDDNRWSNLQLVTNSVNLLNRLGLNKNNTSGRTGVVFDRERRVFIAQIMVNRRAIHLGRFKTKAAAVRARRAKEQQLGIRPC
jgi:hypothetical protein